MAKRLASLGTEHLVDLGERPDVVLPLLSLAVGFLSGEKTPFFSGHPSQDVIERFAGHLSVAGLPSQLHRLNVNRSEKGIVVKHLLEVGHQPALVGRVPREAAAEMIVDAA